MITAIDAYNASTAALTGLTYVDELISGSTDQGQYFVYASKDIMTDEMALEIETYGYTVTKVYTEGNTNFPLYRIDWSNPI